MTSPVTSMNALELGQVVRLQFLEPEGHLLGVHFHLDATSLAFLLGQCRQGKRRSWSPMLVRQWREAWYCDLQTYWPTNLTFTTYYQDGGLEEPVMQTVLTGDARILQQVRRGYLAQGVWLQEIALVHHSLTTDLLHLLPYQRRPMETWWLYGLAVLGTMIAMLIVILPSWSVVQSYPLWQIALVCSVMAILFYWGFSQLLWWGLPAWRSQLRRLVIAGFGSHGSQQRRRGLRWLGRLGEWSDGEDRP